VIGQLIGQKERDPSGVAADGVPKLAGAIFSVGVAKLAAGVFSNGTAGPAPVVAAIEEKEVDAIEEAA
jgi:hypothetical protein